MSTVSAEDKVQKMLSVIHQIPMGLVETDLSGNILEMNAKSVQLLMPLFFSNKLPGTNIHHLLEILAPEMLTVIKSFTQPNGNIIKQLRQEFQFNGNEGTKSTSYVFSVNKLSENNLMYIFDDITEFHEKEKLLYQAIQDKAIEQNKFEIASGVLHDVGNAVVGFGSYITQIKRTIEQNDITTLESLKGFIEKNHVSLNTALGEKKSKAIADLLGGVITNQKENLDYVKKSIADQINIIGHVQEILNIQRQYVKGRHTERATINRRSVINDAVAMLLGALEKSNIIFNFDSPVALPRIKGDRTKLMQVFLNLIKNASESILNRSDQIDLKEINVLVSADSDKITVKIQDNGSGFDEETGANLFNRGYTTKSEGTGLGLTNCKSIIESHNGNIEITSDGIGKGALITIVFNL